MEERLLNIPKNYVSALDLLETQYAIKYLKDVFETNLSSALNLVRVSAPMFVRPESGLNDNLNGVERPVSFDIPDAGIGVEVIHSLAKWKRYALAKYGFKVGSGLYTDMNAIRRDETLDNIHSVYVDQWDWERVIEQRDRSIDFLKIIVSKIYDALRQSELMLCRMFAKLTPFLSESICFVTAQELEERYPLLTSKEREHAICRELGSVFIIGIGDRLKGGAPHDLRAPDYDDWALNGDILIWYPVLERSIELSSMGIRVDADSLRRQLELSGHTERMQLEFHRALLNDELPLSVGGGIGQSRMCMVLLQKAHIGEVQCSVWPDSMKTECFDNSVFLL